MSLLPGKNLLHSILQNLTSENVPENLFAWWDPKCVLLGLGGGVAEPVWMIKLFITKEAIYGEQDSKFKKLSTFF